jgi:hypothetical protein
VGVKTGWVVGNVNSVLVRVMILSFSHRVIRVKWDEKRMSD